MTETLGDHSSTLYGFKMTSCDVCEAAVLDKERLSVCFCVWAGRNPEVWWGSEDDVFALKPHQYVR